MNFLAHLHLAHPTDASRVGALLGDFAPGTPVSLRSRFPDDVVAGIMLHRAIDRFTDEHPVFLKTKQFLQPSRRRFAGIIIDIFFDHFLAHFWSEYSKLPLSTFITEVHDTLERRKEWLTPDLAEILPRMKDENWLATTGTIPGLALTFRRVSRRRDFLSTLIGAEEDLTQHYQSFTSAFREFYPELRSFAAAENPGGAFIWE